MIRSAVRLSCLRVPFPAALLGLLALGCGGTPPEVEPEAPGVVEISNIQGKPFAGWVTLAGATQPLPRQAAQVTAGVEARVKTILPADGQGKPLAEGDTVAAGQVIVQLDDTIAKANLDKARQNVHDLTAQLETAKKKYDFAQQVLAAQQKLADSGGQATSQLLPELTLKGQQVAVQDAESTVRQLETRKNAAEADVKSGEVMLGYHAIRAPIVGHLGMLQVSPGQWVHLGQVITDIVNLDQIDVLCFAPPTRVRELEKGQLARLLTADTDPDRAPADADGKVSYIARQADPQTGSFPVKVTLPNKKLRLGSNAYVRVAIRTQPRKFRMVLPSDAVLTDQSEPRVVVVELTEKKKNDEGEMEQFGKAHIFRAELGLRLSIPPLSWVEILGLEKLEGAEEEKGEKPFPVPALDKANFVVTGARGLQEGDTVKVKPSD